MLLFLTAIAASQPHAWLTALMAFLAHMPGG